MKTKSVKRGGICPAGICNGGFGCQHKSFSENRKKEKIYYWIKFGTNLMSSNNDSSQTERENFGIFEELIRSLRET